MKRTLKAALRALLYLWSLLAAKAIFLLAVALFSLAMTMASFVFAPLANLAYAAATRVFGSAAVSTVGESAEMRQRNQQLERQNSRLAADNAELQNRNQQLQGQSDRQRARARQTAQKAVTRSTRASTRSMAAIPVESIPLLGVSTIIATTSWDIHDTCKLIEDMDEILLGYGEQSVDTAFRGMCQSIPILQAHGKHYGRMTVAECRTEAIATRNRVYELARLASDEIPDLFETDDDFDQDVRDAAQREFAAVNEICDCIADLICDVDSLVVQR